MRDFAQRAVKGKRNVHTLDTLGEACMQTGRHAEAERLLKEALRLSPDHAETLCHLVQLYRQTGRSKVATVLYEKLREIDDEWAEKAGGENAGCRIQDA